MKHYGYFISELTIDVSDHTNYENKLDKTTLFRPFSRALTGPIFGPIPNAKLKFFSQLKK